MLTTDFLLALVDGINDYHGTVNCGHCALRLDDHISHGANLRLGPVPYESAGIQTHALIKTGRITRSSTYDTRLLDKCSKEPADFRVVFDLNDKEIKYEIDLTVKKDETGQLRFIAAGVDNIKERLKALPRRQKDESAYGFIVLTHESQNEIGHIINFYVDKDNEVYFIDAQHQIKELQVSQQLNLQGFRPEIFYIASIPPEGYKVKIENEAKRKIKKEKPIKAKNMLHPNLSILPPVTAERNEDKFHRLFALSQTNSATAQDWNELGHCYENGIGTMANMTLAFNCYKKVTELDPENIEGWKTLGSCYFAPMGTLKSEERAEECYTKAKELSQRQSAPIPAQNPQEPAHPVVVAPRDPQFSPMFHSTTKAPSDFKDKQIELLRKQLALKDQELALQKQEIALLRMQLEKSSSASNSPKMGA
ncbi:MAG: hypothetical protein HYX61_13225 [Gammaproteobacteria bacterium]|jgi:tetratricopeptide (TPR) repeat protein|nr:hypothetical protein [Gammaproteobacteria bacterium]